MRIGATGFFPYIYNANMLQAGSLSRVSAIGDDLTKAGTDYSYLTDASLNINPLGRGESANLFDILDMQMQMSRRNASRVMATEEIPGEQIPEEEILGAQIPEKLPVTEERPEVDMALAERMETGETVSPEEIVSDVLSSPDGMMDAEQIQDFGMVDQSEEILSLQYDRNLYQIQRAAEAYRVQML